MQMLQMVGAVVPANKTGTGYDLWLVDPGAFRTQWLSHMATGATPNSDG